MGNLLENNLENGHTMRSFSPKSQPFISESWLLPGVFDERIGYWAEQKLPYSGPLSVSSPVYKSEYKFLRSAFSSHLWGLVIVTAGWDGWIRTYQNYGLPIWLWCQICFTIHNGQKLCTRRKLLTTGLKDFLYLNWHYGNHAWERKLLSMLNSLIFLVWQVSVQKYVRRVHHDVIDSYHVLEFWT